MIRLLLLSLPLLAQAFQGQLLLASSSPMVVAAPSWSSPLSMTLSDDSSSPHTLHKSTVSRRDVVKISAAGSFLAAALASGAPPALAADVAKQMLALEREFKDSVNSNGAPEKHIPRVSLGTVPGNPDLRMVEVVVPHVMDAEKPHFIQAIWLKEEISGDVAVAKVGDAIGDLILLPNNHRSL